MKGIPRGYKERTDALNRKIIPIAKSLMGITEEFGCDNYTVNGRGVEIKIQSSVKITTKHITKALSASELLERAGISPEQVNDLREILIKEGILKKD